MSGDVFDNWESITGIYKLERDCLPYISPSCYNDMDMLEIGRGMSEEEDKTHFGMWCIMSSPLLIPKESLSQKEPQVFRPASE